MRTIQLWDISNQKTLEVSLIVFPETSSGMSPQGGKVSMCPPTCGDPEKHILGSVSRFGIFHSRGTRRVHSHISVDQSLFQFDHWPLFG